MILKLVDEEAERELGKSTDHKKGRSEGPEFQHSKVCLPGGFMKAGRTIRHIGEPQRRISMESTTQVGVSVRHFSPKTSRSRGRNVWREKNAAMISLYSVAKK